MIAVFRLCRAAHRPAAVLLLGSLFAIGCEKVPLLAPTGSTITLTAAATALPLGGTTSLIAQVIQASGQAPHDGTLVIFTTTLGMVQPSQANTDINGRVMVQFNAGTASGTATITASSGSAGATTTTTGSTTTSTPANVVKIALGAAAVGSVILGANPITVSASGGTSTITATVADANGNLLSGVPVTFTVDAGTVSPSLVTTDSNGKAQTTLTTTKTVNVTATAGVAASSTTGPPAGKVTVTVNAASTITVGSPSPSAPIVGQNVTFALTEGVGGASIQQTVVDFGDGSFPQRFNGLPSAVAHAYGAVGSYLVRVSATDTFGDTWTGTQSVTVAPRPQLAVTVVSPTTTPTPNTPTAFTIAATPTTGNAIASMRIDFGDGTSPLAVSGNATSVNHVYAAAGTYTVQVSATDTSGASGTGFTTIVVGTPVTASFTFTPSSPAAGSIVTFNGSGSSSGSGIASYSWTFGDGHTGSGVSAQNTYAAAGSYSVTLTVVDNAGHTNSTNQTVTVH